MRRRPKKACWFCKTKVEYLDYKDVSLLQRYLGDRSKIVPKRQSGNCAKHQRQVTIAIKRARHLALLPYTRI